MVGPVPGISAHKLPTSVPRNIGANARLMSALLGRISRSRTLAYVRVDRRDLIDAVHELGDAEQAERQRDEFDAVVEMRSGRK